MDVAPKMTIAASWFCLPWNLKHCCWVKFRQYLGLLSVMKWAAKSAQVESCCVLLHVTKTFHPMYANHLTMATKLGCYLQFQQYLGLLWIIKWAAKSGQVESYCVLLQITKTSAVSHSLQSSQFFVLLLRSGSSSPLGTKKLHRVFHYKK